MLFAAQKLIICIDWCLTIFTQIGRYYLFQEIHATANCFYSAVNMLNAVLEFVDNWIVRNVMQQKSSHAHCRLFLNWFQVGKGLVLENMFQSTIITDGQNGLCNEI